RVALHVLRPRAPVRVVLERIEVARLGPELERDLRHLAGRAGMVRRELAALRGLGVAAAAGGENDRCGVHRLIAHARRPPGLELAERTVREGGDRGGLDRVAQRLRDRVPGAVADLEQPLARGAAAA